MSVPTVIFSHGRESGPWGTKIRALACVAESLGCRVVSRDDRDTQDPELRVERLIATAGSVNGPLVLAGSSMGGYVAAVAAAELEPAGLFLMAPAFGMPGYALQTPEIPGANITIVHGWDDAVVPGDAVVRFARKHRAMLHLVPAGHALQEQLPAVAAIFRQFLERSLATGLRPTDQARLLASF